MQMKRWRTAFIAGAILVSAFLTAFGSGENVQADITRPSLDEWLPVIVLEHGPIIREQRLRLQAGDTARVVLTRLGLTQSQSTSVIRASKRVYPLHRLRAGNEWVKRSGKDGIHLFYQIDADRQLHLSPTTSGWTATLEPRLTSSRIVSLEGVIKGSLFISAARVGLDDRTVMQLVNIFSWDIDFARDIRNGDLFRVLVEENFDRSGVLLGRQILAAEFINQGESYRAIRFTLKSGESNYFSPDGNNLRKTYLRSPVKFTRISSRFSTRRKHPILGYTRAHKGVDYAAPTGTPVHAVGDGRVVYKGWRGGYGRYIRIRHADSIHSTVYAHMRRYARGIRRGSRVKQGQIIGYVGMSGLATGPHLHFEFHLRGRAVNPLAIKAPAALPVPRHERQRFTENRDSLLIRLIHSIPASAWS